MILSPTNPASWPHVVRQLKPGAYVVIVQASPLTAFYARAAGLEFRDTIAHAYPGGMETILLCRKPLDGTVADNVLKYGTGGLNIDGCRIFSGPSSGGDISGSTAFGQGSGWNAHNNRTTTIDRSMASGRWPTNLVFTHAGNCKRVGAKKVKGSQLNQTIKRSESKSNTYAGGKHQTDSHCQGYTGPDGTETVTAWDCVAGCPVKAMDEQSGATTSSGGPIHQAPQPTSNMNPGIWAGKTTERLCDSGTASRFYPQFRDRDELINWLETLTG